MQFKKIPISFRLSITHALIMTCLMFFLSFVLLNFIENLLYGSIDSLLLSSGEYIKTDYFNPEGFHNKNQSIEKSIYKAWKRDQLAISNPSKIFASIIDSNGNEIISTANKQIIFPIHKNTKDILDNGLKQYVNHESEVENIWDTKRILLLPILKDNSPYKGQIIQVGTSLNETIKIINNIKLVLTFILPGFLILSIVFGYFLTFNALKPVRIISKTASKISIENLKLRLPYPKSYDEIYHLSETFNKLFDRLEGSLSKLLRFTGDVSHELKTPLTVIKAEGELCLRRDRTVDEYQDTLKIINNEVNHMSSIVNDLLLLTKTESQAILIHLTSTDPKNFVAKVTQSVKAIFKSKNITLTTHISLLDKFPCCENYLMLALKNILINAAKYSPNNSQVHLTFSSSDKELIEITVKDSGYGINKEDLENIFIPFYRADISRNRSQGGCGLGLTLAKALVNLHSGRIEVFSQQNKGTTFTIKIPSSLQTKT